MKFNFWKTTHVLLLLYFLSVSAVHANNCSLNHNLTDAEFSACRVATTRSKVDSSIELGCVSQYLYFRRGSSSWLSVPDGRSHRSQFTYQGEVWRCNGRNIQVGTQSQTKPKPEQNNCRTQIHVNGTAHCVKNISRGVCCVKNRPTKFIK